MAKIPEITRKELYDMTTKQLYALHGEVIEIEKRITAELIARGDY